jgi:hypothetical protein
LGQGDLRPGDGSFQVDRIAAWGLQKRVIGWKTSQTSTLMRAYTKQEIGNAFEASGFMDAKWHGADETGYFQPIFSAVSPS